jgi:uncharacterized iron-regulated membrane protein
VIYNIHFSLLGGETGHLVVGIVGIFILSGILSGVYLWYPKSGKIRAALKYKSTAKTERKIYDIHKLSGIYAILLLISTSLSGTYLTFPKQFEAALDVQKKCLPVTQPLATPRPVTPQEAMAMARGVAKGDMVKFWLPIADDPSYLVGFVRPEQFRQSSGEVEVAIDSQTGQITCLTDPVAERGLASGTIEAFFPMHNGEILGTIGRVIIIFLGALPTILFVTGFLMWRTRRKARMKQKEKRGGVSHAAA